jgi:deoxyribonuclease-4
MKFGLKLPSNGMDYLPEVIRLRTSRSFDYIELFVVPGTFESCGNAWFVPGIRYVLHAPHSLAGMNLSIPELLEANRKVLSEVEQFRALLNPSRIIFHGGMNGKIEETARQMGIFRKEYPHLFEIGLIENKPKVGINGECCIGYSPEQIALLKKAGGLEFCFDVGHAFCAANSLKMPGMTLLERFLNMTPALFHFSDGSRDSELDSHLHLGEGDLDLKAILERIPSRAWVTLETPKKSPTSLDDFEVDVRNVNQIIG